MVAVVAFFVFRARLWMGIGCVLVGIAIVAQLWSGELDPVGVLFAFGAATSLTIYFLVGEREVGKTSPIAVAFWTMSFATAFWLVFSGWWQIDPAIFRERVPLNGSLAEVIVPFWVPLLWIVVLGSFAPFVLSLLALKHLTATAAGVVALARRDARHGATRRRRRPSDKHRPRPDGEGGEGRRRRSRARASAFPRAATLSGPAPRADQCRRHPLPSCPHRPLGRAADRKALMRTIEHGTTARVRTITTPGAAAPARTTPVPGLALVRVNDSLWRVVRPAGELIGYVEEVAAPGGTRYRAKRFLAVQRRVLIDGEFWAMDDALECFRTR